MLWEHFSGLGDVLSVEVEGQEGAAVSEGSHVRVKFGSRQGAEWAFAQGRQLADGQPLQLSWAPPPPLPPSQPRPRCSPPHQRLLLVLLLLLLVLRAAPAPAAGSASGGALRPREMQRKGCLQRLPPLLTSPFATGGWQ